MKDGRNPWLCEHDELPAWAQDNEFIVRGHRRPGGTAAEKRREAEGGPAEATANGASGRQLRRRTAAAPSGKGKGQDKFATLGESDAYEHDTYTKCWNSMWHYWHNETVNIHSHFWGLAVVLLVAGLHVLDLLRLLPTPLFHLSHHRIFSPSALPAPNASASILRGGAGKLLGKLSGQQQRGPSQLSDLLSYALPISGPQIAAAWARPPGWMDIAGFAIFFVGAFFCLGFSATFHCLQAHSCGVAKKCNQLDYVGIVVMICGSFVPALHYGFHCLPQIQAVYTVAILALGAVAIVFVVAPRYATPAYRPIRTGIFIALGLCAVFPVAHVVSMYGRANVAKMMGLNSLVLSGALYITGALLYAMRVPERFAPGRFDYLGASHQIFHCLILAAAWAHYVSIRRGYAFWHTVEAVGGGRSAAAVCAALDTFRNYRG